MAKWQEGRIAHLDWTQYRLACGLATLIVQRNAEGWHGWVMGHNGNARLYPTRAEAEAAALRAARRLLKKTAAALDAATTAGGEGEGS